MINASFTLEKIASMEGIYQGVSGDEQKITAVAKEILQNRYESTITLQDAGLMKQIFHVNPTLLTAITKLCPKEEVLKFVEKMLLNPSTFNPDDGRPILPFIFSDQNFEELMKKPNGNQLFDGLLPILTSDELNEHTEWRQKVLRFAFSKERYDAVFMQDDDISEELTIQLSNTRVHYTLHGFDFTGVKEEWNDLRMESSSTLTGTHIGKEKSRCQWLAAQQYIMDLAVRHRKNSSRLEINSIRKAHLRLAKEEVENPGTTRDEVGTLVRVGGEWNNIFCLPAYLEEHFTDFESWVNNEITKCDEGKKNPIVLAGQVYERIVTLHPFENGNGRVARLMMDYTLLRYDIPPPILHTEVLDAQFTLTPVAKAPEVFIGKILRGIEESYEIINK